MIERARFFIANLLDGGDDGTSLPLAVRGVARPLRAGPKAKSSASLGRAAGPCQARGRLPSCDERLTHHAPPAAAPGEALLDPRRQSAEAELKGPRMKADVDDDVETDRRARLLELAPAEEVLPSAERPQPERARRAHDALPGAIRRRQHQESIRPQDARELAERLERRARVLEHLARDDDVEALVAHGQLAGVGHESAAAGTRHRARHQSRSDVDADDHRPAPDGRG